MGTAFPTPLLWYINLLAMAHNVSHTPPLLNRTPLSLTLGTLSGGGDSVPPNERRGDLGRKGGGILVDLAAQTSNEVGDFVPPVRGPGHPRGPVLENIQSFVPPCTARASVVCTPDLGHGRTSPAHPLLHRSCPVEGQRKWSVWEGSFPF